MGQVALFAPFLENVAFGWKQLTGKICETTHTLVRVLRRNLRKRVAKFWQKRWNRGETRPL